MPLQKDEGAGAHGGGRSEGSTARPAWGNMQGEVLGPDLKGNACNFCPLSMMLAVGLSDMAFIMFRYVPSIPTLLRVLIINEH